MKISPLHAPLGAELSGLDLNEPMDAGQFARLYAAWLEYGVLVFPNQALTESSLVSFSARIGQLERPPASESRARGDGGAALPEIWNISNVKVGGVPIGSLGDLEADWHTDMSYLESPPVASILYAREIPARGGNTSFANMYLALAAMPAELRRRLETLCVRHDSAYTSVGELRTGAREVAVAAEADGAIHPAVRVHPETGRRVLYLGRRLNASFVDLPERESEVLLDEAWAFCTQPRFVYEHVWRLGDVVMWDNRCTIHRRNAFDSDERRIMWRTQVGAGPNRPNMEAATA